MKVYQRSLTRPFARPSTKATTLARVKKAYKKSLLLSDFQREVIYGMVLGDASLCLQKGGREAYLALGQGEKQEDLVDHLFHILQPWTWYRIPSRHSHGNKNYPGRVYTTVYFQTFSHRIFTDLHKLFYRPQGSAGRSWVKVIPEDVEKWMSPTSFAYHVMTDGSFKWKSLILHTENFAKTETTSYAGAINKAFDLHGYVTPKGPYWIIRFPTKDLPKLQALLKDLLLPTFRYKVGLSEEGKAWYEVACWRKGALDWS